MSGETTTIKIIVLIAGCVLADGITLPAQESEGPKPPTTPLAVVVDGVSEPVYRMGDGVKPPKVTYQPQPEYSEEGRQKHIAGHVVLAITVTSKGEVTQIRVVKSLGSGLDEKAVEAVRKWKFKPARKDGKPVSVSVAVDISFPLI